MLIVFCKYKKQQNITPATHRGKTRLKRLQVTLFWKVPHLAFELVTGEVMKIKYKRSIQQRLSFGKQGWVVVHHFVPNFMRELSVSSKTMFFL